MARSGPSLPKLVTLAAGAACLWTWAPSFLVPPSPEPGAARVLRTGSGLGGPAAAATARPAAGAQESAPSTPWGLVWQSAAAAACAFVASSAVRRLEQRRSCSVLMRVVPSQAHRCRQKVLRRLEPYGEIPSWTTKPLLIKKKVLTWRSRTTPKISAWGRQLIEKQRIRFHYNLKDKQLKVFMMRAFRKGVTYPVDNLMQQLESRLDNFVWRTGLAPTMAGARHFVREGHIQYMTGKMTTWRTINVGFMRLKVGDRIRVKDRPSSQKYGRSNLDKEPDVVSPAHLTWDREKMEGSYDDICDIKEIGMNVNESLILLWYSGSRGLKRTHFRYFEGSMAIIKKGYRGGRVRPTPENLINMKNGNGLNPRGRRRPPALWGRKVPLNNPYETGRHRKDKF